MQIKLARLNDSIHFQASNEQGRTVEIDGAENSDLGQGNALAPMQLVLAGAAGCSVFDVVGILKKQRQSLEDIKVTANAERSEGAPSPFRKIHLHFDLYGLLNPDKVARAVVLAVEKYCSVLSMLSKTANVSHSFEIHPGAAGSET